MILRRPRELCKNGHLLGNTRVRMGKFSGCGICKYEYNKKYKENNPNKFSGYYRKNKLKKQYGISPKEFDTILQSQNYVCAICRSDDWGKGNVPHIGHDHKTGKIRGILCSRCNCGLGMFLDDINLLESAKRYLL